MSKLCSMWITRHVLSVESCYSWWVLSSTGSSPRLYCSEQFRHFFVSADLLLSTSTIPPRLVDTNRTPFDSSLYYSAPSLFPLSLQPPELFYMYFIISHFHAQIGNLSEESRKRYQEQFSCISRANGVAECWFNSDHLPWALCFQPSGSIRKSTRSPIHSPPKLHLSLNRFLAVLIGIVPVCVYYLHSWNFALNYKDVTSENKFSKSIFLKLI